MSNSDYKENEKKLQKHIEIRGIKIGEFTFTIL